jgi:hypothetical protein
MMDLIGANQQMQGMAHNVLHVGVLTLFIGPPPPPDMQRKRFLNSVIPSLFVQLVQEKVPYLYFDRLINVSEDIWGKSFASGICAVKGGPNVVICEEITPSQDNVPTTAGPSALEENISVVTPMSKRKKINVPVVQSLERRFTRSYLNEEGYMPRLVLAVQPKIKKLPRAKLLVGVDEGEQTSKKKQKKNLHEDQGEPRAQEEIPVTPVHVLQRFGRELGIASEKLTKDQLEADPVVKKKTGANEDKI